MAYIGKEPIVGNFQKCDAITVVNGQAAYTLQVGGANVSPESVNHMIVSLNGVIQVPTTAYTVAGAVLTFDSNLATGDVIDFVLLLGNVLDIGTPSDDTVATAKIQDDAVTLAKMAAGTDGNIISYDTSGNPVAVATGNDGQVLTSSGAGAVCAFEDAPAGGLTAASQWRLTTTFQGDAAPIASNWEEADAPTSYGVLGSSMTQSSGIFTFPSTGYWLIKGQVRYYADSAQNYCTASLYTTHDNSTYAQAAATSDEVHGGDYGGIHFSYIFDVTSTSNCKCRMDLAQADNNNDTVGSTDAHLTGLTFIRLADT